MNISPYSLIAQGTGFAASSFTAAGAMAALSSVAMAADPHASGSAASSFGVGHVVAFAAGAAALKSINMIRTRFAARPATKSIVNVLSSDANFVAAKQAALSRTLPPLGDMKLPFGVTLLEVPGATYMMGGKCEATVSSVYWMTTAGSNDLVKHLMPGFVPLRGAEEGNLPANVNWEQGRELARRVNEQYPGPVGLKWRLPTEAERERAMRGRNLNENDQVDTRKVNVYASNNGKALAVDAAGYTNDLGLFHIRGNVWEWCEDGFAPLSLTAIVNPRVGMTERGLHVLRGGSYFSCESDVRLAHRNYFNLVGHLNDFGFRLVLAPEDS